MNQLNREAPAERGSLYVFQLTAWSIAPFMAACVAMAAYHQSRQRGQVPGRNALSFLYAALTFWCLAQTVTTLVASERAQLLATQFSYVGIALTPVAWFLFALTYSQRVMRMSRRVLNVIAIVPVITIAMVWTNSWHNLMWSEWHLTNVDGFVALVMEHGFWFYVHAIYSYCLVLVATAILAFALTQFRQHSQTLLAAVFAPLIVIMANLFYLSPANPLPWFDLTTIGSIASILILEKGILEKGKLKTLPVVREQVVEQLTDPVLVITHDGGVVDANASALTVWGSPQQNVVYSNLADFVELPLAQLVTTTTNSEVPIDDRTYEVSATRLDASDPASDIALVFRDITDHLAQKRQLTTLTGELERMAHTDGLTGLFNRRFFMQRLGEEFERVRRHKGVLSVLLFDLDHFKSINDTYGHDLGDSVLVAIGEVTEQIKRVSDIAARIGGEEFALLLPETGKQGAINLAQRLRKAIEEYPYRTKLEKSLYVTASIGVATVTQSNTAPENLLKVADRALYRAKHNGRNMVCIDDEDTA
jgi:diguanylate cyclase (GGDEF)-like protein